MSRWFRVYDDMLDDPKMQRLPPATFKAVINLWCLASKNGGKLPCFEDITFGLRMEREATIALLDEMVDAGLLDHDDDNGLRPHNWDKRQYKSDVTDPTAAERMRRHRNAHRNATVAVTPPRTDTETEQNRAEKKEVEGATAPRPRKRRELHPLPDDWQPPPGADLVEVEKMRNWAKAQDIRRADWNAQYRNWVAKSEEYRGKTGRGAGNSASGGSLIAAIDKMRASLAGGQDQAVVLSLPPRQLPGPGPVHGSGGHGAGAVRRVSGGDGD